MILRLRIIVAVQDLEDQFLCANFSVPPLTFFALATALTYSLYPGQGNLVSKKLQLLQFNKDIKTSKKFI